jgi:predicted alpha/beta hydrolase family esterase
MSGIFRITKEINMTFNDDVTAVNRVLAARDGPTILVGHSYGGAIITDAGKDSHVVGLVYIAAHALDRLRSTSLASKCRRRHPSG